MSEDGPAPNDAEPSESAQGDPAQSDSAPDDPAPDDPAPDDPAQSDSAPDDPAPDDPAPDDPAPDDPAPDDPAPDDPAQGGSAPSAVDRWPPPHQPLLVALVTTAAVTVVSQLAPDDWANTAVGAVFLGVTWLTVLRGDTEKIRRYGMSLGGVTEPEALGARRIAVEGTRAVGWALLMAAIFFPPFWIGYKLAWTHGAPFLWRVQDDFGGRALGQVLVIALPEEAFFRGYLQSSLDGSWSAKRWRVLGAEIGPGWLLASLVFAVGHVLTVPNPARLAVFFPALLFGWMRARTGGIGAGVVFHALCNTFSGFLAYGYGLAG